ncbi:MAG: peptide chain release factor N(5)-glutamine methyltransferase [Coriobacteriia bacterium]|nr:peptide chain release factor N(5)-glutamine methyltransferase [Coriobacteriia bacterium]
MQLSSIQDALAISKLPRLDTELLLSGLTGLSRTDLYTHLDDKIDADKFYEFHDRRFNFEPIQYITGKAYFRDLELNVGPGVLIPRPETELITEIVAKDSDTPQTILDIGTGSGCLAICLAKMFPEAHVVATDISEEALSYAKKNIDKYKLNVELIKGTFVDENFDLAVSNPPYIPSGLIETLSPEVRDFEPILALDGGEDGLKFLDSILDFVKDHAKKLILELHEDCLLAAKEGALNKGFNSVEIIQDLNKKDRFLVACI